MALFDKFTKKDAPAIEPPASLSIDAQPGIGYAPVSGRVIRMTDVPDKVFSTEVLGKGCALWPDGDVVYAPANGWVGTVMGRKVITAAGYQDCVVFAVSNSDQLADVELTAGFSEKVEAGAPVLKVTF